MTTYISLNIENSNNDASLFSLRIIKILTNMHFFKTFSAYCLDYGQILKKFENNPWVRITVLNYTVTRTYVLDLQYIGIVSWCSKWRFFL